MMRGFNAAPRWALPVLLVCVTVLVACGDSGNSNGSGHSDIYYHSHGFHDPYYYGEYDYDYEPVIVPPSNNGGGKPNRPGDGDRPGNGLRPSHPIANPPGVGNNRPERPSAKPTPSHRKPSLPSRARPSHMGRSGMMRGGGMRGGMRGGGMRGGGGRR